MPRIERAELIAGRRIRFREIAPEDAAFIVALRTAAAKSAYLSPTSPLVERQVKYIEAYRKREGEAYFIIADMAGRELGAVRLYDAVGDSFSWGSWILAADAPSYAAIESALIVYSYAVGRLGFSRSHFTVHKANESVCRFHERFGARKVGEDDVQNHYVIDRGAIEASLERYRRYLPDGIEVSGGGS
jgi:RimJ/RimL family protein N-acetyltransferase